MELRSSFSDCSPNDLWYRIYIDIDVIVNEVAGEYDLEAYSSIYDNPHE